MTPAAGSQLAILKPRIDGAIVTALEEALARAKSGDTVGIVLIEVLDSSDVKTCIRIGRRDQIIYGLEYAKHACMREAFEGT